MYDNIRKQIYLAEAKLKDVAKEVDAAERSHRRLQRRVDSLLTAAALDRERVAELEERATYLDTEIEAQMPCITGKERNEARKRLGNIIRISTNNMGGEAPFYPANETERAMEYVLGLATVKADRIAELEAALAGCYCR